jgi:AraC-like DNA-binding protein
MFTDTLLQVSDVKALRGQPAAEEQMCSFWVRPDGQMCVQYLRSAESVSYQPHTHSEYHLVICLAGAMSKTQMGVTHVIEPGELIMGNFGVGHSSAYLTDGRHCETICLAVDRRILWSLLEDADLPLPAGQAIPVFLGKLGSRIVTSCAQDVVQELRRRESGQAIVLEGLAMRVLVEAMRAWPRASVQRCEVDWTPRLPRHDFVRAYEFMRWCRKDTFRVEQLCEFLGASEERFTRLFRAATNYSPARFYGRMLLERSRSLLQEPARSVKEVGDLLGFKTSSHFIVAFRREYGTTPLEYRRACTGLDDDCGKRTRPIVPVRSS